MSEKTHWKHHPLCLGLPLTVVLNKPSAFGILSRASSVCAFPPLEHSPHTKYVLEKLSEMHKLVPQLVDGQVERHVTIAEVARVERCAT